MKHSSLLRAALPASAAALLTLLAACSKHEPAAQAPVAEQTAAASDALAASVSSESRSAEDKARDQYRHPQEALAFWGLQPGMTILEVQPGGGWWTEILAPYAHATGGKYYATAADLDNPELSEGARKARAEFEARFAAKPEVYGQVQLVNFGAKSRPLPENTFDFVLSARSVHGWMGNGITDKVLKDLYGALKPGGILAIEQHRANPGEQDPKAESGYVT
jgi:predicted methyltransferase